MPVEMPKVLDGRQIRTARSRLAICDACIDLIQEGVLQPNAEEIADRAGLSRRSIFNHFADLAELYDAVTEAVNQRYASIMKEVPCQGSIESRVDQLVLIRSRYFEASAPFARALVAQSLLGPDQEQARRIAADALLAQHKDIERLFGPDLAGLPSAKRAETIEAISAVMAPSLWDHLRRSRGNSLRRARAITRRMLMSILQDAGD